MNIYLCMWSWEGVDGWKHIRSRPPTELIIQGFSCKVLVAMEVEDWTDGQEDLAGLRQCRAQLVTFLVGPQIQSKGLWSLRGVNTIYH